MALLSNTTVYGTLSGSGIIYDLTSNSLIWASGYSLASGINTQTGNYATTANLATTGTTLNNKINSLSGYVTGADATFATIINLASTGSTLDTKINNLSGYVTGVTGIFGSLPANLASTGSTLNSKINSLSGYVDSQDTTISNNLRTTGSTLDNKINSLSGNLTSTYSTIVNLASTGSNLNNSIISLSGLFTGYTGTLDATFATDLQLYTTGSTLDNKINSLSGNLTANYATIINLASTGSNLNNTINNLSGYINSTSSNIVFTTGNQTISGNKSFVQDTTFGDSAQGDFLVISGNNFTVYGSGNFTSGLFVNGNTVLTGSSTLYATSINLAATGSTLDNKINSLSGNLTSTYVTKSNGLFTNRPTVNGTNILLSGESIVSGDLTGSLPYPTINKLQGYKVDLSAAPADGQTLQWDNGTSSWKAGAIPVGGNGGGGRVYYFDFLNISGILPTGGLPSTGLSALSLLGRDYSVGSGSFTTPDLAPQNTYRLISHFVTASGDPAVTNIPAGLWDFNIWANTDSASATQTAMKAVVNIYNPTNSTYRYLSQSDDVYLYDQQTIAQYLLNVTVPQTGIASNERIYIQFYGLKTTNPDRTITLYFDSYRPSHVHTTIPSVAGNGVVKVVNGVFQSPATGIFDADVDNAANIQQSKILNLTSDLTTLTNNIASTGSTLNTKINNVSGYINSSGSNIVFTTGDQTIAGNKSFTSSSTLSVRVISGFKGSSPDSLNLFGTNDNAVNASILLAGNINLTAGTGSTFGTSTYGAINLNAGGPKYNGNVNLNGNINFNLDTSASTLSSRTINFYKTGISFGSPNPVNVITIDNSTFSINNPVGSANGGIGFYISGVGVTPALYATITGVAFTGSTLDNKINSLSGWSDSAINLASTGSNLDNKINNVSGYVNLRAPQNKTFVYNPIVTGGGNTTGTIAYGANCTITPKYVGTLRADACISMTAPNVLSTDTQQATSFWYGTGTAPVYSGNLVNLGGTRIGGLKGVGSQGSIYAISASWVAEITGLNTGTQYWFDIGISGLRQRAQDVQIYIEEKY